MKLGLALLLLARGDDDLSTALPRLLHGLRERVGCSVVAIAVERDSDPEGQGGAGATATHRDYLNRPRGPVSGVIYESAGWIVTSYFNVSGSIRKNGLTVTLPDGRELPGELYGFDRRRDVALLKVEAHGLPALPKADLKDLAQGAFVALVGRAPDPRSPTLNVGVLSAIHRMRDTCVQTDAEMNYGNAGGALVTLRGGLVGVACRIKPRTSWGQSGGIGFACKVAEIDQILPRLKNRQEIEAEKLPYLGIQPGEGDPEIGGVQVGEVSPDSPARKGGLREGDVIVAFDGRPVTDFESLRNLILGKKIGDEVALTVKRRDTNGREKVATLEFKATLEGRAEE